MGRIPEETIRTIAEANDIVEVISGYFPLQRVGSNYRALCPFHSEKTPSFNVSPARQSFHCFGCGAGGTVFGFLMDYENLDFPSAVKKLAERANIPVPEDSFDPQEQARRKKRERYLALHREAAQWFHQQLLKDPAAQLARDYLRQRDISIEIAKRWQLGYAPSSWEAFLNWAREKNFPRNLLVESGLASEKNGKVFPTFRHRILFPILNDYSEPVAFSGRVIEADSTMAKYLNSPETAFFHKGKILFGLAQGRRAMLRERKALLCEGQFDCITAQENGLQYTIAPLGTALTDDHARLLKRHVDEITLCFDSDRAGRKATERSFLALANASIQVRVVTLPEGEDPDSTIRQQGHEAFLQMLENAPDFFEYEITLARHHGQLDTPQQKLKLGKHLLPFVAALDTDLEREMALRQIATTLQLPITGLETELITLQRQPRAAHRTGTTPELPRAPIPSLNPTEKILLQAYLLDDEFRQWMAEHSDIEQILDLPEMQKMAQLMAWCKKKSTTTENTIHWASVLATLPAAEQSLYSSLLHSPFPEKGGIMAREYCRGLQAKVIDQRIKTLHGKLQNHQSTLQEVQNSQKEILDLQKRLLDISRSSH